MPTDVDNVPGANLSNEDFRFFTLLAEAFDVPIDPDELVPVHASSVHVSQSVDPARQVQSERPSNASGSSDSEKSLEVGVSKIKQAENVMALLSAQANKEPEVIEMGEQESAVYSSSSS